MQTKLSAAATEPPIPGKGSAGSAGDCARLDFVEGIAEFLIISISGCQPKLERK